MKKQWRVASSQQIRANLPKVFRQLADKVFVKERVRLAVTLARRTFLVDKKLQFRIIGFAAFSSLLACTFFYAANAYFFYQFQGIAIDAGFQPSHPFFKVISNMEDQMTWIFAITSVSIILFTTLAGIVFSNRIAGPLHRMKSHFESVARGETLSNISFRQGDCFDEVARAYNHQMERIRGEIAAAQAEASKKKAS